MNQYTKLFKRITISDEDAVDVQLNKYLEQHPYYEIDTIQYVIGYHSEQLIAVFKIAKAFQANLPNYLITKEKGILVNGIRQCGSIKPYAIKTDKNGFPHFLVCLEGNWAWVSAKHFKTEW